MKDRHRRQLPIPHNFRPKAPYRFQRGGRRIAQLLEVCRTLKLNEDPQIAEELQKLLMAGKERLAEKYLRSLLPEGYAQLINPDPFLSAETPSPGEFLRGYRVRDGIRTGVTESHLGSHTLVWGATGTGKSNLLLDVVYQAVLHEIHVMYIDPKEDLAHASRYGADVIPGRLYRINPLCPLGPEVRIYEYENLLTKLYCELFGVLHLGQATLLLALQTLYRKFDVYARWPHWDWETMYFPTLRDLLRVLESKEFRGKVTGWGRESLNSLIRKFRALLGQLGPVVDCQRGFDLPKFYKEKRIVSLLIGDFTPEAQVFLSLTTVMAYASYFKAYGPRDQLNMLLICDEARNLLGVHNEENLFMSQLFPKLRGWGIGLMFADQVPSLSAQYIRSNVENQVIFRLSDGNDIRRVQYSARLTPEQADEIGSLQTGEFLLRSSTRFRDVHRLHAPFYDVEKFISREELWDMIAPRIKEIFKEVIPIKGTPQIQKASLHLMLPPAKRAFLETVASNFERPYTKIAEEMGLSKSQAFRIKKDLVRDGFLTPVETSLGKGGKPATFLIPNPDTYEGTQIPIREGRGGLLHKHYQQKFAEWGTKSGFKTKIEQSLNRTPEAADVGLTKGRLKVAAEICITSTARNEAANIEKALRQGFNHLILTFINTSVLQTTQKIANETYPEDTLKKVSFCLVNHFLGALRMINQGSGDPERKD